MALDILIVDDEEDIRDLVAGVLSDDGYETRTAATAESALEAFDERLPSLVLLDVWLRGSSMDGLELLKLFKTRDANVPVIVFSGHGNIEIAVAAIKQGAYDFIEKPFNIDQLMVVVSRAMETSRLRRENADLRRRDVTSSEMLGSSPAFKALKSQLEKVTKSNGRVMLSGPAGAGKEMAARFIHSNSGRSTAPFISVSSATIESDRMEEVLFGRETVDRGIEKGLLEQAHGGVVYFDEVAEMPLGTQSKILRVLTEQQFTRVGGSDKVRVDLRVISSTSRDLRHEIAHGRFRQELYDRLNVVPIAVPSLAERREDIPELTTAFIEMFHRTQGLPLRKLTAEAEAMLQTMQWPGNIRQLRNVIERVLILGDGTGPIDARELPGQEAAADTGGRMVLGGAMATLPLREAREVFEREYLLTQINRFGGNISRTAGFVGMERSALHRKLKSLGVVTTSKSSGRGEEEDEV